MSYLLIKNGNVVFPEGVYNYDILIDPPYIVKVSPFISMPNAEIIDAEGLYIFPGIIDTHVHFREPGLTHKANFYTESAAAIAGGVTTVIDMPNTIPFANHLDIINYKKKLAQNKSFTNIGFFIGAQSDNLNYLLQLPFNEVAGIKLFMGSSTGNIKVDDDDYLSELFKNSNHIIAIHAESETIIKKNLDLISNKYKDSIPFEAHSEIRSKESCLEATKKALSIAQKYGTNIHILHISTAEELDLFDNQDYPHITSEICIPHLWFTKEDFKIYKGFLKCNPSVKTINDREILRKNLKTNKVSTIATDHAPHTQEEKQSDYLNCPSGTTSIQHSLLSTLELYHLKYIDLTDIPLKMSLNPAKIFKIKRRGFIKENFFADLVIVNLNSTTKVSKDNLLYKCRWSCFEGFEFHSKIEMTIVNGQISYKNGNIIDLPRGMLLEYSH